MEGKIRKFVYDAFEIEIDSKYQFKKLYGLTFVFKNDIVLIKNRISSNSLTPVGIIYEENNDYFFAAFDKNASISDIVIEYVNEYLK